MSRGWVWAGWDDRAGVTDVLWVGLGRCCGCLVGGFGPVLRMSRWWVWAVVMDVLWVGLGQID